MSSLEYNWQRFWCEREDEFSLDDGYLQNPGDENLREFLNPAVKRIEEFEKYRCLILLGEPGLGKSFEVKKYSDISSHDVRSLFIDLSSYDSVDMIDRKIFQGAEINAWLADENSILYLTLESFDECLLRVEPLTSFLLETLRSLPLNRFFLRIVCRTGYWPVALEKGLCEIYKEKKDEFIKIIELMPLRRMDVESAANDEEIDVVAFMQGISSTGITAFAARPITLMMLLNKFKSTGELPKNQVEMYKWGSRRLCSENNQLRWGTKATIRLTNEQKLIVAGRIATAMVFSNNSSLWIGPDDGNIPRGVMHVEEIYGSDGIDGESILVDQHNVLETLATGLFSSRGQNQIGWSHQTYGEFLAADYLIRNSVNERKIMSLISIPGGRIIPKFYNVAAWIALMNRVIFEKISKTEPKILLLGDITANTEDQKVSLTKAYLEHLASSNILDWDMRPNFRYDRLNYDGIADQVMLYIDNHSANENVRIEAMCITEACRLKELGGLLADIALDIKEPYNIRSIAARVVSHIAKSTDKERLKRAIYDNKEDSRDEIRGYALTAVWPEYLTVEELFNILTPPKRNNYFGGYSIFILRKLVPGLKNSDIPVALQWVIEQDKGGISNHKNCFKKLGDNILRYAWINIKISGVMDLFAKIVLSRIKAYQYIIGDEYSGSPFSFTSKDDDDRHLLIERMMLLIESEKSIGSELRFSHPPLVSDNDAEWLLTKLSTDEPIEQRVLWASLLRDVWQYTGYKDDLTFKIYDIYRLNQDYKDVFFDIFEAVDLSSSKAIDAKKIYESGKKYQLGLAKESNRDKLNVGGLIKDALKLLEEGNNDGWWQLIHFLAIKDNGGRENEDTTDITLWPSWNLLDDQTKGKIQLFAENYILTQEPETIEDLNTFCELNIAAYKALFYLQHFAAFKYNSLPSDVWEKWAMVVVQYPICLDPDNILIHQQIVKSAYSKAPEKIRVCLTAYIDYKDAQNDDMDFLCKFSICWDDELYSILFSKVTDGEVKLTTLYKLLVKMIEVKAKEAIFYIKELVNGTNEEKALTAAKVLLFKVFDDEWKFVWAKTKLDVEFGKKLMLQVASFLQYERIPFTDKLSEIQLAELYIWLVTYFPHKEDPQHDKVFSPNVRDNMVYFRDGVLETLIKRGSKLACEEVGRIRRELPALDWLGLAFERAEKSSAEKTWLPPRPRDVISMVRNSNLSLVKSGEQLLEVVVESLQKIQIKLQGETPLAPFLWDNSGKNKKPKCENECSDFIVSQLRDELVNHGIILNREVEIRSTSSGNKGERTDIHIDAVSSNNSHDIIKVIVEVKGCWHGKLLDAMKTQLVGEYLRDNDCKHGLYLVVWFNCPQWDSADSRRTGAFRRKIEMLTPMLNSQADELSKGDVYVRVFIIDASLRS